VVRRWKWCGRAACWGAARLGPLAAITIVFALAFGAPPAAATQCGDAGPWCNGSLSSAARARLLMNALTQAQKISLLAGDDLLGVTGAPGYHTGSNGGVPGLVPRVNLTDGTNGIRQGSATALPDELAVAAGFDPSLARLDGQVLGNEAKLKGNDVIYGPTLTVMRTPLAGRTFQGIGEDPFLGAETGVGLIDGIQSQGVIANANIFVANNQEGQDPTGRSGLPGSALGTGAVGSRYTIDAHVDQRTLREIYLPPFQAAVQQAHVGTVMCAYNLVNGTYNCENSPLLNGILKHDWGFNGFVLSDYGAAHDTVASLNGGLDFEPWPGTAYSQKAVTAAVDSGLVSQAMLDAHVFRYLRTLFSFGVFDRPAYTEREGAIKRAAHAADALKVEERGITLLRNRRSILPLNTKRVKSIAVIGKEGNQFLTGGGSSSVTPYSYVTPLQGITKRAGRSAGVTYNDGSDLASAVALAKRSKVAIVVAADYEIEGVDLQCLTLECPNAYGNQDSLIRAVAAANPNTIVVLETGGPVLTPWRGRVKGLVEAWYPGEKGGTALARVLFGDVDPSGHLPVTFPNAQSQEPTANDPSSYPGVANQETYKEGVFVGYRWFDAHHLRPAFPFGFGLSYTHFAYRRLTIRRVPDGVAIGATVTNSGRRVGTDVAQLYLGMPGLPGVPQPPKQLKGFDTVSLRPGQSKRVTFVLNPRTLSYWDAATARWRVASGCYRVMVGDSSAQLPLRGGIRFGSGRRRGVRSAR
jgi:beta-glucosidase